MSTTQNLGITKPADRESFLEVFLQQRFEDFDDAIANLIEKTGTFGTDRDISNADARTAVLKLSYVLSASISVKIPTSGTGIVAGASRKFIVWNNTTGGSWTVTIKTSAVGSTGVIVPRGYSQAVWHDGTNVYPAGPPVALTTGYVSLPALAWNNATLLNSWANSGGIYQVASYSIGAEGLVRLRGLVAAGTLNNAAAICTLPAGYRPAKEEFFPCESAGAYGRVRVDTSGNVIPISGSNSAFWLSGVCFQVA
jgi:hypothetical protein